MDKKPLSVVCGTRSAGPEKLFWALDTRDFRVYVAPERKNIDAIATEVDDFIGYPPKGYIWDIQCIGNSRCSDICARIRKVLEEAQ